MRIILTAALILGTTAPAFAGNLLPSLEERNEVVTAQEPVGSIGSPVIIGGALVALLALAAIAGEEDGDSTTGTND